MNHNVEGITRPVKPPDTRRTCTPVAAGDSSSPMPAATGTCSRAWPQQGAREKQKKGREMMGERDPNTRMRAREAGIILGALPPGTTNSIADVAGVRVGHTTLIRGNGALVRGVGPVRTGVTAILPHDDDLFRLKVPAAASVFNGFGKTIGLVQLAELGQLETPILLTNTLNVGRVADALVAFMVERNPAIGVTTGTVNPVVCECNDGFLNDIGGRHVGEQEVRAALTVAPGTPVLEGTVGAGTGMTTYCFAGGIGTASRCLSPAQGGYTLGALVQSNFGRCGDLIIGGVPVGRELEEQRQKRVALHVGQEPRREQGSIIVILATDAPLDARQLGRLARRVPLGLARTGTSGGHGSGDLAIAFSTADRIPHDAGPLVRSVQVLNEQNPAIDGLFSAVVEATEEAVINALCTAHSMDGRDNHWAQALSLVETLAILKRYGRIQ